MVTVTETVTESAAAPAAVPDAASETANSSAAPKATDAPEAEAAPSSENAVSDSYDFGNPVQNARGNLVKETGQWAGIATPSGEFTAVFRVTDIEVGVKCTSPYAQAPQNGQFVALTFEVHTMPELAEDPIGQVHISPWAFSVFDEDNKRENDSVGTAYGCLNENEVLPEAIGPGEEVKGKIVLDTGVKTGSVALNGRDMGVDGAWAWEF